MIISLSRPTYIIIGLSTIVNFVSLTYIFKFHEILEKEVSLLEKEVSLQNKERELLEFEDLANKEFDVSHNLFDINQDSEEFKEALEEYTLWKDNSIKDKGIFTGADTFALNRYTNSNGVFLFRNNKVAIYNRSSYDSNNRYISSDSLRSRYGMGKVEVSNKNLFFVFQENDMYRCPNRCKKQILVCNWRREINKAYLIRVSNFIDLK